MYLDDEEVVVPPAESVSMGLYHSKIDYDESIYSDTNFQVVVTTNGANYDSLYSVELNDSELGECVYTDQSETYHATSTIKVEADQSYTTEVSLTIPSSTGHTTYLSDRTISLTKILFSRDTVDGTFPADIPENSTTALNFEVHAIDYFDSDLGYQVQLNEGLVDVVIKPNTPEYVSAQTAAVSDFVIPNAINGYGIGRVYLQDLSWIETLSVEGASEDVFVLGEFPLLATMTISGLSFAPPVVDPYFKHLTINGEFSLLTSIIIEQCSGYWLFISDNAEVENEDYSTFKEEPGLTLYSFPELMLISVDESSFRYIKIGDDSHGYSFPKLAAFTMTNSFIGDFYFGNEQNEFPKLASPSIDNTNIGTVEIEGSKPDTETPALLDLTDGHYSYITIKGSIIGGVDLSGSTISFLELLGGTIYPSALVSLILDGVEFNDWSQSTNI